MTDKAATLTQISSGGVAFRQQNGEIEVAIIQVGDDGRWQLPKGLVDEGEDSETAARREVREEAGLDTERLGLIDKVEYWYYSTQRGQRVRYHKFVYFYLLRYLSGDVRDHDQEVNEARWVAIEDAIEILSFKSEKQIVQQAKTMIEGIM
jgi:8-oxo-dGTP pyrophosphatase MutT (NUDIX family)